MEERRISFLKYRNTYGHMTVAYREIDGSFYAGVSFCNPCDFNIPRRRRVLHGQGLAISRIEKDSSCLVIPNTLGANFDDDDAGAMQLSKLRLFIFEFVADNVTKAGVKAYNGKPEKNEFNKWFPLFVEEELKKLEKKLLP